MARPPGRQRLSVVLQKMNRDIESPGIAWLLFRLVSRAARQFFIPYRVFSHSLQ